MMQRIGAQKFNMKLSLFDVILYLFIYLFLFIYFFLFIYLFLSFYLFIFFLFLSLFNRLFTSFVLRCGSENWGSKIQYEIILNLFLFYFFLPFFIYFNRLLTSLP